MSLSAATGPAQQSFSEPHNRPRPGNLQRAQGELADGLRTEADGRAACVDCYYRAAIRAWTELECAGSAAAGVVDHQSAWLNALHADPELYRRFQVWYFRYPTGGDLLESVATLREQLQTARDTFDPAGEDEALERMVLIGHSMGGLVARLQISFLWKSPPTSIDLLEPDNPLLAAMARMPLRSGVRLHSITGTGGNPLGEPSDGIVPVSSARLAGVASELRVPVRHTDLHHDDATLEEVKRILREHARESP